MQPLRSKYTRKRRNSGQGRDGLAIDGNNSSFDHFPRQFPLSRAYQYSKDSVQSSLTDDLKQDTQPPVLQTEEDKRFLRLAQEALVATGRGVDPTIQDLLQRLQYASLSHGIKISNGTTLRVVSRGPLDVHESYKGSPKLDNDRILHPRVSTDQIQRNVLVRASDLDQVTKPFESSAVSQAELYLFQSVSDADTVQSFVQGISSQSYIADSLSRLRMGPEQRTSVVQSNGQYTNPYSIETTSIEKKHQPQRNYECTNCPMSFHRQLDLKRHEKQHLIVLPNVCELCHKGFARKDALKRHLGTLTCQRNSTRLDP